MKGFVFIWFLFIYTFVFTQEMTVDNFQHIPNDLDARVNFVVKDQNGDKCSLLKISATEQGFTFEGGQLGIVKTEYKTGEYWIYIPWGSKRITIKHKDYGVIRDYAFDMSIEEANVYSMELVTKSVKQINENLPDRVLVYSNGVKSENKNCIINGKSYVLSIMTIVTDNRTQPWGYKTTVSFNPADLPDLVILSDDPVIKIVDVNLDGNDDLVVNCPPGNGTWSSVRCYTLTLDKKEWYSPFNGFLWKIDTDGDDPYAKIYWIRSEQKVEVHTNNTNKPGFPIDFYDKYDWKIKEKSEISEAKEYFYNYLDTKSQMELFKTSFPTLDECKLIFKDNSAYTFFGYVEDMKSEMSKAEPIEENETYVDCRIESFSSNDVQHGEGNYAGGMEKIKDQLQSNVTFYRVTYLRVKDAEYGMSYKYFVNIKGEWVFIPKPWNVLNNNK